MYTDVISRNLVTCHIITDFYIQPLLKQILFPNTSPNYTIKVITTYYLYYKIIPGITKFVHKPFVLQLPLKLLLLPIDWSNCIVKFAIYHPHFKDKVVGNLTWTFVCIINYLHFLCYLNNLLAAFFLLIIAVPALLNQT